MIEVLKADIQKYEADAARLTKEIAEHEEDIAVWTGDSKAATKVREIEKADYDATQKDYSESVDALERAIAVLKKQAHDRKQAGSLVQVSALKNLNLSQQMPRRQSTPSCPLMRIQQRDLPLPHRRPMRTSSSQ